MEKTIESEQEMREFGEVLASRLRGGEVIELIGDVGAGKTTFVKGLAKGLGADEDVQSPSFTLSRVYDLPGNKQLAHYDFYRLSDPGILADELADIVGRRDTIVVIEWADIVEGVLPSERISLRIASPSETVRTISLTGVDV